MSILKSFISFLIIFTMITPTYTIAQDDDDSDESPYQTQGGSCVGQEEVRKPGTTCCSGLEFNSNTDKCDEITYNDTSLTSCTNGATCSGGTGCFPQKASDLFSIVSPGSEDSELESMISAQMDGEGNKAAGSACTHARECASYSCVLRKCEDKKVCRFAGEGEFAGSGISCGTNLVKTGSGVCEKTPEAKNPVYLGLVNEVIVEPNGKCQFELDEDTRQKSVIAMKTLRAMEWMFANISLAEKDDCFQTIPLLKDVVGKTFVETRKGILTSFTDVLNEIENDYATLINAKEKSDKSVTMHGETISEGDLATRQTSGYDSLMIMYRRNLLFQSYEKAMLETVKMANKTVSGLSQGQATWNDGDTSWKIGDQTIAGYQCEAKYKKWKPFSWKTKYYMSTKDRWIYQYEVTGSAEGNASVVKRPKIASYLSLIGGMTSEEAITDLTKSKYYLLDPLMHGGLNFESFGQKKKLGGGGFLGLGKKDLRKARFLKGDSGSYTAMYNQLKPKVKDFYKTLKAKSDQKNFVYEPELMTVEAKDCLTNPTNKGCEGFEAFLDEVLDEGFAQFLAYSAASKDSYSGYFTNATSWRRRLLAKLEVDMQNISKYYETVLKHRDDQNTCIERVINGVIQNGILTEGNDQGSLVEGEANGSNVATTTVKPGAIKGLNTSSGNTSTALRPELVSPLTRSRFTFDLDTGTNKNLNKSSLYDGMVKSSSSTRGGVGDQSSASALAIRQKDMRNANAKASSKGVNVAGKESSMASAMKSVGGSGRNSSGMGSGSGSGSGSALSNLSSNGFSFPDGKNKNSGSGFDLTNGDINGNGNGLNGVNINPGTIGVGGANTAGSGNGNGLSESEMGLGANGRGMNAGSNSGSGSGDGTDGKDGTGLSDSEKERMMSGYEKNRRDYEGAEDDNLFSKVSKAYVRNLDKVLIRKKKLEN